MCESLRMISGTFICHEDGTYIDESKVCDGVPDCSPSSGRNTTEDELWNNCPEEVRRSKGFSL